LKAKAFKMKFTLLVVSLVIFSGFVSPNVDYNEICVSKEEKKLFDLVNEYRRAKRLKPVPFSAKLTKVAQVHVRDLMENYKANNDVCNLHTWSSKGKWSACCYTDNHKQAQCMWDKPKEIADYATFGYEIAYYSSDDVTAEEGLSGWKTSPGHNSVMMNMGIWHNVEWKAMGVGLYKNYGVVWFGETEDESKIKVCD
jgi:Cysteine-rich secretory protein family